MQNPQLAPEVQGTDLSPPDLLAKQLDLLMKMPHGQRKTAVAGIGRVHGNRHVQRLVEALNSPPPALSMLPAGVIAKSAEDSEEEEPEISEFQSLKIQLKLLSVQSLSLNKTNTPTTARRNSVEPQRQTNRILRSSGIAPTIQRDQKKKMRSSAEESIAKYKLPEGADFQVFGHIILVRHSWLKKDPDYKVSGFRTPAPQAIASLLRSFRAAGILSWITDDQIDTVTPQLYIKGKRKKKDKTIPIGLGADVFGFFGAGPGSPDILWRDAGKGMTLIVGRKIVAGKSGKALDKLAESIIVALETKTNMKVPDSIRPKFLGLLKKDAQNLPSDRKALAIDFSVTTMEVIFGKDVWAGYLEKKPPAEELAKPGKGGMRFTRGVKNEDKKYFEEWVKKNISAKTAHEAKHDQPDQVISQQFIDLLKRIDKHPQKKEILAKLNQKPTDDTRKVKSRPLDTQALENIISDAELSAAYKKTGMKPPTGGIKEKLALDEPVEGKIINRSGYLHAGEKAQFYFKVRDKVDVLRVPWVFAQWVIIDKADLNKQVAKDRTSHMDLPTKEPDYFGHTFTKKGTYEIHAFVRHNFYRPAHFKIDVEVRTEAERMAERRTEGFKGMGGYKRIRHDFDTSSFNERYGTKKYDVGEKFEGTLPSNFKRLSFDERTQFIKKDRERAKKMLARYEKGKSSRDKEITKQIKAYLKRLDKMEKELTSEKKRGYNFIEARATFLSRKSGIKDAHLHLLVGVKLGRNKADVRIHDYTQLWENKNYLFSAEADSYEKALEEAFVDMCKSYPPGRLSFIAEKISDKGKAETTGKTIGFELDTGTAWKAVKSVVYDPYVQLAVNVLAVLTMIFLPVTTPVILPLLISYNVINELDRMEELFTKGKLTWKEGAASVGSIALEFLPILGRAKVFLRAGKRTWFVIEGAQIAGQTVIVTRETLNDLENLRDNHVKNLAVIEEHIQQLEKTNPSDPKLPELKKKRDRLMKEVRDHADNTVLKAAARAGMIIIPGVVGAEVSRRQFKKQLDDLVSNKYVVNNPEAVKARGKAYVDSYTGTIVADTSKITAAQLAALQKQALKRHKKLFELFGTPNVKIVKGTGNELVISKKKDTYIVTLAKGQTLDDALIDISKRAKFIYGGRISREHFKTDIATQKKLFEDAKRLRREQEKMARDLMDQLNIEGEAYSILKRKRFKKFVAGILEKMKRKGYAHVHEMDDIVRGRMNLETYEDVLEMVKALRNQKKYAIKEIVAPRTREGVKKGYPRFHVILRDPKTGLTHEWQIGTKATTRVFEKPGIIIPKGLKLKKGMKPDIHDIEYDIFKAVQEKHGELAQKLGIPAFRKKVASIAAETGTKGSKIPQNVLDKKIDALHDEASKILEKLVEQKGADWVQQFYH